MMLGQSITRGVFGARRRGIRKKPTCSHPRGVRVCQLSGGRAESWGLTFLTFKGEGNVVRLRHPSSACAPQFSSLLVVLSSAEGGCSPRQCFCPGINGEIDALMKLVLPKEPLHGVRNACPHAGHLSGSVTPHVHHFCVSSVLLCQEGE